MITIYYNLVKAGRRTIDQVPAKLQEEVRAMINAENTPA
ncbi:CD1375 family protein [Brevibacillus choshinensis]|nr:CD1375 family protein [Brevibacillus choshinensis]MED4752349.1 CD1375 family protein [Brevibacillus choshinensis]